MADLDEEYITKMEDVAGTTDHLGRPRKVLDRDKIRRLHDQGLGVRAIASKIGVSHMTVHRIVCG